MQYISHYSSPLGNILLAADETGLTGLWFEGQKYFALYLDKVYEEKELPVLKRTKQWYRKKAALLTLEKADLHRDR